MIKMEEFLVDAPLRQVKCRACGKKCWSVIHPDHFAFRCVTPDCSNRLILYLVSNFFEKVAENLNTSATPKELDLSKPLRTRLTKKFFLSLPARVFIVSNIFDGPAQPTYFKSVSPAPEREKQWKEIVLHKCDQRTCTIFKNQEGAMAYLSALYKRISTTKPPDEPGSTASDSKYESLAEEFCAALDLLANQPDSLPWETKEDREKQE